MSASRPLTPEQAVAAWQLNFRHTLDGHPDSEIAWEAQTWRALNIENLALIAETMLTERRANDVSIPGGADAADLDALLSRVDVHPVLRLVHDEAQCLLAALRLVYWSGLRDVPR